MNQSLVISTLIGIFLAVCVLFEAFVITRFRVTRFKPALLQATLVNVASVTVLYFIWPLIVRMDLDEDKVFPLLPILLITTVVVEGLLLKLLNREQPWSRIFGAIAVANTAGFIILYSLLLFL